jgi:hypothetical protein
MPPEDTLTSEWDLITALSREFGAAPPGVILGIGDDCAALAGNGQDYLLWTVDTLVEGVHFDLAYTTLSQLGWKSLTVNLSDIAAMGGDPGTALLSLGCGRAPARLLYPGRAGRAFPPGPHRGRGPGRPVNSGGRGGYLRPGLRPFPP